LAGGRHAVGSRPRIPPIGTMPLGQIRHSPAVTADSMGGEDVRKLVVWNLMTLDGYFEGAKPWDIDFHNLAWGPELERYAERQAEEGDLLVFGRRTYEGMAAYWPTAEDGRIKAFMNGVAKIVVSRTMQQAGWSNSRVVGDPVAELTRLKVEDGKAILIFGSAELTDSLLKAGLVDELRVCIVAVLLGNGKPLFKPSEERTRLKLLDVVTTAGGSVILRYEPTRPN
jgi:dihydrofolate reductase